MGIFGSIFGIVVSVMVIVLIILWILLPILMNLIRIDVEEKRKTLERIDRNYVTIKKYVVAKAKAENFTVEWEKK